MVDIIARGDITRWYNEDIPEQTRVNITYGGYEAHLGLYRFGDRQTWIITGYRSTNEASGEHGEGAGASEESIPQRPRRERQRKARRASADSGALRGRVELRREERDPVTGAVTREA